MANAIRYSTTGDTQSLKKGNFFFGVGDVGKGPSSATTYYNGSTPVASGYTIYSFDASQTSRISYASPTTDSEFIRITNAKSGQNFTGVTQCLNWYATQTDHVAVNKDYEPIVSNGLVLNLDAGFTPSYTSSGTTWYDLSYSGNNGTLTNGPTYSSANGGSILFDGTNDYVSLGTSAALSPTQLTVNLWFRLPTTSKTSQFYIIRNRTFGYGISSTNRTINFFVYPNNSSAISYNILSSSINFDIWYNVTMTYGNSIFRVYLNGILQSGDIASATNTIYYVGNAVSVGRDADFDGAYLYGNVSNTQIYNRALTATEVLQNFNAQKSRFGL